MILPEPRHPAAPAVRPLAVWAVSLLLGSFAGSAFVFFPFSILCLLLLVLGGVFLFSFLGRCSPAFACAVFGAFLLGTAGAALADAQSESSSLLRSVGPGKADLIGVIAEPVRFGPDRAVAVVAVQRLVEAQGRTRSLEGRIRLSIRGEVPPLVAGELIEFRTRLRPPGGFLNPGGYDYAGHLRRSGIQAVGNVTLRQDGSTFRVLAPGAFPLLSRVDQWRGQTREAALRTLPAPLAGLYLALVTGETGHLTQDVRDAFMASGTTHILSISGSHLGLIGLVVFWCVRRAVLALPPRMLLRLSAHTTATRVAAAATILPVMLYALLGGAEVATVRSLVMILIVLAATLLGRTHSIGTGLALALLLIVGWDPLAPFDISFQLSFLSVLVIVLVMGARVHSEGETVAGGVSEERGVRERVKEGMGETLLVSILITVASAPLVATYFNQVAWVGGVSNILVVPFVGFLVLPASLLACVGTLLGGSEELLGSAIVQPLLSTLIWMAQGFAAVPGAELRVPSPAVWQMLFFYLFLGACFLWWRRTAGWVAGALVLGLLVLWAWAPRDLPESGTVRLTFLDVGQGDAALVETADGRAMLIDGGSASDSYDMGRMVVAPLLWDRGIRRLDLVVASHPQQDHVGGLAFVVDKFEVGEFWTNGVSRDVAFLQRLEKVIVARGVPVRSVSSSGNDVSFGDCLLHVLNPASPPGGVVQGNDGKSLNNQSVVLHLQCGRSAFLFTGDVEREAERGLADRGDGLEAAILKVPHHGARGSVYGPFLRTVKPHVAVVSVGRANTYGHPSSLMLETYAGLGIPVLRTDVHGAITVLGTETGLQLGCESGRRLKRIGLGMGRTGTEGREILNWRRLFGEPGSCNATV
ncbi:MAG: DNA internalization-related competence protein ComEC/Rec2 [Nitrospirae bacterium]|nr:MAG: DNA internalization-related competence protein ComEC/Rec2 [Nitrospirota bacterium]